MEELNITQFLYNVITLFLTFLMGSIWGISIVRRKLKEQNKVDLTKDGDTTTQHVSMPGCILRVEQVEGVMLFYDTADNQFMCQGTTLEESAKNFSIVTKNQLAGIFTLNNERFVFHDAECLPVSDYNESKTK